MEIEKIGHYVRMERHRRGLTQKQLAELAGVSKGRIEAVENGQCLEMGLGTVNSVAVALGFALVVAGVQGS